MKNRLLFSKFENLRTNELSECSSYVETPDIEDMIYTLGYESVKRFLGHKEFILINCYFKED